MSMSGLRVYVNPPVTNDSGCDDVLTVKDASKRVFYTRRGNGPIYRWLYEEAPAHWRHLRLHTSDIDVHHLAPMSLKSVPKTLMLQLSSHYLD